MKKTSLFLSCLACAMAACAAENLTFGKNATASINQEEAENCVSLDAEKYKKGWRAHMKSNESQWLMVDLGEKKKIGEVILRWSHHAPLAERVEISADGKKFKEVAKAENLVLGPQGFGFPTEDARFVRLTVMNPQKNGKVVTLRRIEVYAGDEKPKRLKSASQKSKGRLVKMFDFEDPSLWRYRDPDNNIYYAEGHNNFMWGRKDLYIRPCQGYEGTGLSFDMKGISSGQMQFWTPPWPMKKDKYYKISYLAKGVNFDGGMNVFVRGIAGWNTIIHGHSINLTDEWQEYSFSGKADKDYDGIVDPKKLQDSFGILFNTSDLGQVKIDNIRIEEFDENPKGIVKGEADNPVVKGNLIPNSSCEIERNPFWSCAIVHNDAELQWKDPTFKRVEGGKFGKYCYKLESQGASKHVMDFTSIYIPVAQNTSYTFSFWAKATEEKGNWGAFHIKSRKGTNEKALNVVKYLGTGNRPTNLCSNEWRRFSMTIDAVPPGVKEVWISIVKGGPGEFWLDGFQFEATDKATDYQPKKPYEIEATVTGGMPNIVAWGEKLPVEMSAGKALENAPDAKIPVTLRVVALPDKVVCEKKFKLKTGETIKKMIEPNVNGTFRLELVPEDPKLADTHENIAARLPKPREDVGRESFFGTHMTVRPYVLDYARRIGIRWQRMHDCSSITKMSGGNPKIDEYVWFDKQVDGLKAAGFYILGLPDSFPKHALRDKKDPLGPVDNEAFAKWCRAAAEHYKGRIDDWELVNEPYMGHFYPGDATRFAETFRVGKDAIRAGNPNARVLGWCTELMTWGYPASIPKDKIRDIDTATIHMYFGGMPGGGTIRMEDDIARFREKILAGGNQDIPMWNSEGSWGGGSAILYSFAKPTEKACENAAACGSRIWLAQKAAGFEKFFYYTMHQFDTVRHRGPFKMLLEYDRSVTIAAAATAVTAWFIDGLDAKPVARRAGAEEALFSGKGRTSFVAYKDPISTNKAVLHLKKLPSDWLVTDVMGNDLRKGRKKTIELAKTPIYILAETEEHEKVLSICQTALMIKEK